MESLFALFRALLSLVSLSLSPTCKALPPTSCTWLRWRSAGERYYRMMLGRASSTAALSVLSIHLTSSTRDQLLNTCTFNAGLVARSISSPDLLLETMHVGHAPWGIQTVDLHCHNKARSQFIFTCVIESLVAIMIPNKLDVVNKHSCAHIEIEK